MRVRRLKVVTELTSEAMKIEQLMTREPRTCRPDSSLSHAAALMWENDLGCLPVTQGGQSDHLVGIITDRDICMAAHFRGRALNEIRVAEAMTSAVWACNPGDELAEAVNIMREAGVRRLPVIDESERVIGLLSLADLAREALRERGEINRHITVAEVGLVLARICQQRQASSLSQETTSTPAPESSLEIQAKAT